jgi:DNA-directed RNA polymerase sigma subunit (sigma70/sigma32)
VTDDDQLLEALDELVLEIRENERRNELLIQRAEAIKEERARGVSWREIVAQDRRPLIVELLTQNAQVLTTVGSRVRRMEARALHAEGLSMDRIAELFGVSRQRISQLLKSTSNNGTAPAEAQPKTQ